MERVMFIILLTTIVSFNTSLTTNETDVDIEPLPQPLAIAQPYLSNDTTYFTPSDTVLHPCTTSPFSCTCKSIWDSDCYCSDLENTSNALSDHDCDCAVLYKECWDFHRELMDYNLTDHCPIPSLEVVSVTIVTTSLNPEGMKVLNAWKEVLEVMQSAVNFKLLFALKKDKNTYTSDYGSSEVILDTWILCAMQHYTKIHEYYPFIYCLNQNYGRNSMDTRIEACAKGHDLNYTILKDCTTSAEGQSLLDKSTHEVVTYHKVPTVLIDSHVYTSQSKKQPIDYMNALCLVFSNPLSDRSLFPWWVFTFMACIAIALLLVIWIAKSDASWGLSSLFCGVFYEIDERSDYDNAAEEVLRLWQAGALPDEDEDEDEHLVVAQDNTVHQSLEDSDASDVSGNENDNVGGNLQETGVHDFLD